MPSLKDLKNRISSVKSTQKITKAMKMVAASKLRKAQESAEEGRPYAEKMERMLVTLAAMADPENAPPLLAGRRDKGGKIKDDVHLIVVDTADRGLCGALNSSVVRETKKKITALEDEGKQVKLICFGRKGWEQLKYGYESYVIEHYDNSKKKAFEYSDANDLATKIIELFEEGQIDSCSMIFNMFESPLVQRVTDQQLIPVDISRLEEQLGDDKETRAVYCYEPEEEEILRELLPRNIKIQLYHAMLENIASEHGARMTAMDNATRNAGEMIDRLTLQYNRTRQAAITTELIEIISGAEAL